MNLEIAKLICECSDLEIFEDYSGRGMYGRTTTAITADSLPQFLEAVSMAYHDLITNALDIDPENSDYHDECDLILERSQILGRTLESIKIDSMGMGMIFY